MDWSNERYVRLYTRDTADMVAVGWEGRTVLYELLRKVDRSGVLDHGGEVELVPEILRLPQDLFLTGFARLVKRGVILVTETALVLRNFIDAQESEQTDRQRQAESRARRRDKAMASGATPAEAKKAARPDYYKEPVTPGHTGSHVVTAGHSEPSLPSLAEPEEISSAEPTLLASGTNPGHELPKKRRKKPTEATEQEQGAAVTVLGKLSERSGREYRPTTSEHVKLIVALLRRGYSESELRLVVWDRSNRWSGDPKMDEYLRPATVFGPEKFADYLAAAKESARKEQESRAGPDRSKPSDLAMRLIRGERVE